jgi:hypothetical protein
MSSCAAGYVRGVGGRCKNCGLPESTHVTVELSRELSRSLAGVSIADRAPQAGAQLPPSAPEQSRHAPSLGSPPASEAPRPSAAADEDAARAMLRSSGFSTPEVDQCAKLIAGSGEDMCVATLQVTGVMERLRDSVRSSGGAAAAADDDDGGHGDGAPCVGGAPAPGVQASSSFHHCDYLRGPAGMCKNCGLHEQHPNHVTPDQHGLARTLTGTADVNVGGRIAEEEAKFRAFLEEARRKYQ